MSAPSRRPTVRVALAVLRGGVFGVVAGALLALVLDRSGADFWGPVVQVSITAMGLAAVVALRDSPSGPGK